MKRNLTAEEVTKKEVRNHFTDFRPTTVSWALGETLSLINTADWNQNIHLTASAERALLVLHAYTSSSPEEENRLRQALNWLEFELERNVDQILDLVVKAGMKLFKLVSTQ